MITVIELDCGDIPPACGFACGGCIQEIQEVLEATDGVQGFAQHLDGLIEVRHDSAKVTPQDLLEAVSRLPTSYEGNFRPTLVASRTEDHEDSVPPDLGI